MVGICFLHIFLLMRTGLVFLLRKLNNNLYLTYTLLYIGFAHLIAFMFQPHAPG